ncbi:MAG: hypothetical protein U1E76_09110 [Planctomycetota bacterium]
MKTSLLAALCLGGLISWARAGQSPDLMTLEVEPNTPISQGTLVTCHVTGAIPGAYLMILISAMPGNYNLGLAHLDVLPPFMPILVGPLDPASSASLSWTAGPVPQPLTGHILYVQGLAVDIAEQQSIRRTWWVSNVDALVFGPAPN